MDTSPINPVRRIANTREQAAAGAATQAGQPGRTTTARPVVSAETLGTDTAPPIDHDRVSLIRKAIAEGSYPVVPAKIADAMIAAGILLRTPK
ncbi:flagellar biosynthesis anti-sigma factor FlgM [Sphingomonas colocasiae]|uniref:Negative regulator of flagellin synthesis n=1 Tax=Sphingomonas colocasiae TaxID=1848973 RepID=A0ABS7PT05_9SPHN|nr:flagellar biosynthesis anti-sigma factor FlgM [Sphingomonas colocasiae]